MDSGSRLKTTVERGFSFLEALVAVSLSSIILTGLFAVFSHSLSALSTSSSNSQALISAIKAYTSIAGAYTASGKHRFDFAITTFKGSETSGSGSGAHPLAGLRPTSAPRLDSDIITFISLSPQHRGRIRSWRLSADSITLEVCGMIQTPRADDYKSVVILSVDGPSQAVGEISYLESGCVSFRGTPISGLISRTPAPRGTPLELITVSNEQSIFIDRTGELRLASHVGMRITENQPLARGFRFIRLKSNFSGKILSHTIEIKPSVGAIYRRLLIPSLTRRALLNEVLP